MFNAFYPNAAHYQLTTKSSGEKYDLFVTVFSMVSDLADVEVYCPQTSIFDDRKQLYIQGELSSCINAYLQNHLHQHGFDCELNPVDKDAHTISTTSSQATPFLLQS